MTPLVLVSGFLGAGKTSFLRDLLPRLVADGLAPHVVLNDYQNAHVDALLLRDQAASLVPINGSCVCCGSRDDLLDALAAFDLGPNSFALVEANGTTDTEELLEFLAADRRASRYAPPQQVAVVDVKRWQRRHWNNDLERRQVRTATHIVFSRLDETDASRQTEVETEVRALNPFAVTCDASTFRPMGSASAAGRGRSHTARDHAAAIQMALPKRVSRADLADFLATLPGTIVRAKGVAWLDTGEAVLFQKVEGGEAPRFVSLGDSGDVPPVAVLIGPDLPEDRLRAHPLFRTGL